MTTRVVITSDHAPLKNSAKEQDWKSRLRVFIGTLMGDAQIQIEFQRKRPGKDT